MEENYCGNIKNIAWNKIRYNRVYEYWNELKKLGLSDKCIWKDSNNNYFNPYRDNFLGIIIYKKTPFLMDNKRIAVIDINNKDDEIYACFVKSINVYDASVYNIFKKFGEKYNFDEINKCWEGAEDEYIVLVNEQEKSG